jgi:hypothetical protein
MSTAMPEPSRAPAAHLQSHFLAVLPRIEGHARVRFRHIRCPDRRDDAVAEAVAVAWESFLRLVEEEEDIQEFGTTLADFAVGRVLSGRRLCGRERAEDVLSRTTHQAEGYRVEGLHPRTRRPCGSITA